MTIKEFAIETCNGCFSYDVTDTDIDIWVCLDWDVEDESNTDPYYKFLTLLAQNVQVDQNASEEDDVICCKFSDWAKQFNDKIYETMKKNNGYFEFPDKEEAYYNFISDLDALIPGNANDATYQMWIDVFTK